MPPRLNSIVLLGLLLCMSAAVTTFAATPNNLVLAVDCTGFESISGSLTMTRDNTGTGREAFSIAAVDGTGRVVYNPQANAFVVGGEVSFGEGTFYTWTAPPAANPIALVITSLAGNELPSQTILSTSGNCTGLPNGNRRTDAAISAASGARIDDAASGANEARRQARIEQLPGYVIVDTFALNVRSGDGPEFTRRGQVAGGTYGEVVARNTASTWWLVDFGGLRGWVNADFLIFRGDLTDIPVRANPGGRVQPATFVVFVEQPIYREPENLNRFIFCDVAPGEYRILGVDTSGLYYQIGATCTDGRQRATWIEAENGAFRNPSGLPPTVIETN